MTRPSHLSLSFCWRESVSPRRRSSLAYDVLHPLHIALIVDAVHHVLQSRRQERQEDQHSLKIPQVSHSPKTAHTVRGQHSPRGRVGTLNSSNQFLSTLAHRSCRRSHSCSVKYIWFSGENNDVGCEKHHEITHRLRPSGSLKILETTPSRANRSGAPFTPGFLSGLENDKYS